MSHIITLVCQPNSGAIDAAMRALAGAGFFPNGTSWLSKGEAVDVRLSDRPKQDLIHDLFNGIAVDWALQNEDTRGKALLLSDMDSTMIGQECIDELADMAGVGPQVAAVTERTMRGELNFEESIKSRVATLKGLSETALDACYQDRIVFSNGAEALLRTLNTLGVRSVLVSGGFTAFTKKVAAHLGFDDNYANRLEITDGALTGNVIPPILGAKAKLYRLEREIREKSLSPADTIAIGDGANDLDMLEAAGLGIAYKAKPVVRERASAVIQHTDLRSVLYFMGLPKSAIED